MLVKPNRLHPLLKARAPIQAKVLLQNLPRAVSQATLVGQLLAGLSRLQMVGRLFIILATQTACLILVSSMSTTSQRMLSYLWVSTVPWAFPTLRTPVRISCLTVTRWSQFTSSQASLASHRRSLFNQPEMFLWSLSKWPSISSSDARQRSRISPTTTSSTLKRKFLASGIACMLESLSNCKKPFVLNSYIFSNCHNEGFLTIFNSLAIDSGLWRSHVTGFLAQCHIKAQSDTGPLCAI